MVWTRCRTESCDGVVSLCCLNPPAARTHLYFQSDTAGFVWAIQGPDVDKTKAEFDKNELPAPEPGSMCYMMSKQQNFGPKYGNADPHLMFWFPGQTLSFGAQTSQAPLYTSINTPRSRSPSSLFPSPNGRTERLLQRIEPAVTMA